MSNISNNTWGDNIRLTDSWERRGRLWLQTSGLLSYKAWTSHTRLCRQIYVEKKHTVGKNKKKSDRPQTFTEIQSISSKSFTYFAWLLRSVTFTLPRTKFKYKLERKQKHPCYNKINKTDGLRWTCGMKKHWPIPLWQIRFHVKEDIFFIFDLWFDVRYELQVFLITAFCTPVNNNRQNEERLMLIIFNSASTSFPYGLTLCYHKQFPADLDAQSFPWVTTRNYLIFFLPFLSFEGRL